MEENKNPGSAAEAAPEKEGTAAAKKTKKDKKNELAEALSEIERLKAEIKEKDDKHLRMAAEYENFRRRSREEKDAVYENAMSDTLSELLPIIDNLERAAAFDDCAKVMEGLEMISKSVSSVLGKLGVESFGAPGDSFDPNLHNAVMHEENDELGDGIITDVFQKGYKKGSKIIRFAMVKTVN